MPFEEDIHYLLDPSPHHWKQRLAAAQRIGQQPLSERETREAARALIDVLEDVVPGDTRNEREAWCYRWLVFSPFLIAIFSAPLLGLLALCFQSDAASQTQTSAVTPPQELPEGLSIAIATLWGMGVLLPPIVRAALLGEEDRRINRLRAAAIEALGRIRAPEVCGVLAGCLFTANLSLARAARQALKQALPMLTPDHYGALESSVVPNLCRALLHSDDALALLVLEALGKMGDGRAVRSVEETVRRGRTEAICRAAEAILPVLRERQQQENDRRMLLRGSSQAVDTLHLLHALSTPEPPEQLLRPTQESP